VIGQQQLELLTAVVGVPVRRSRVDLIPCGKLLAYRLACRRPVAPLLASAAMSSAARRAG